MSLSSIRSDRHSAFNLKRNETPRPETGYPLALPATRYPLPATRYPLLTRASLGLDRLRFAQRAKAVKLTVKRNTFAIKVRQPLG